MCFKYFNQEGNLAEPRNLTINPVTVYKHSQLDTCCSTREKKKAREWKAEPSSPRFNHLCMWVFLHRKKSLRVMRQFKSSVFVRTERVRLTTAGVGRKMDDRRMKGGKQSRESEGTEDGEGGRDR